MTTTTRQQVLSRIVEQLKKERPDARYELNWNTPFELLIATMLAAQYRDEGVNEITPRLFAKYPNAQAFANADLTELAEDLLPVSFHRRKAEAIRDACGMLVEKHGDEFPATMEELVELPRVARKTANVVLTEAFGIPSGIVVDQHVARTSQRLGITTKKQPEKIELELMEMIPQEDWIHFGAAMVLHGRYVCRNHAPQCDECSFDDFCEKQGVNEDMAGSKPDAPRQQSLFNEPPPEVDIPEDWKEALANEIAEPWFRNLLDFVERERVAHTVYPPREDVFNALKHTPLEDVSVLLLGQDPYHGPDQAHGLCFSVQPGVKVPPSLANAYKELKNDLGCTIPSHGYLVKWAEQGVLMLNAVLTVRQSEPNSHKDQGWERFTDAIIQAVSAKSDRVVFVLWGAYAQKKSKLIDETKHVIVKSAHPSPLSSKKFFGSKPFSKINQALTDAGKSAIDWQIDEIVA